MPTRGEYDQTQGVFQTILTDEILKEEQPAQIVDNIAELLDIEKLYV